MISSKRSFLFFIALLIATATAIPNVQAKSKTLLQKTIEGDEWKVNYYPKVLEFRLKKNGDQKCKKKVFQYRAFLACSTGYLGSNYYDEIYKAIKSKI